MSELPGCDLYHPLSINTTIFHNGEETLCICDPNALGIFSCFCYFLSCAPLELKRKFYLFSQILKITKNVESC